MRNKKIMQKISNYKEKNRNIQKKCHTYNDESIKSLKGADRVRLRPGVMFGSDNIKGAFHTFKEILGNSLDEARGGYGKEIEVHFLEFIRKEQKFGSIEELKEQLQKDIRLGQKINVEV